MAILKKYRKSPRGIRLILDISMDTHATLHAILEEEIRSSANPSSNIDKKYLRCMERALKEILEGDPVYEDNFKSKERFQTPLED